MAPRVLKFVRTDEESSSVLVHVSSKGSKALDLKLIGTEGAAPYACSLRHDRVSSLRVKNCPVSETEWQNILISIFQQELHSDIRATATVQSESSIVLTVRKQVQGITQRLGAISLNYEVNETIELFDWCAISVDALTQIQESATESAGKFSGMQASVDDLKSQLDELIQAKQEDEVALLQKFRDLLNEKKVKIRQQQKIIMELSVNGRGTSEEPKSKDEQSGLKPSGTRATKRKAKAADLEEPAEELTVAVKSESEDSDGGHTTEATASVASDDDNDDDDDDDDDDDAMDEPQGSFQGAHESKPSQKQAVAPPPPRSLPFQRKKPVATANDTDSDDEL
ncbi:hypothetical protein EsDP_00002235 [Epichloe bromicola]|uniref:DNA double-strand break repair and VJ recombination XRCC4 n=1 Tax=Epichloe bromicola TaxID=79588 RepID=A0ABQ0CK96_9HYPO